ncbi:MAG: TPR-domain containing protein [Promethearchaeota archaeon CR_4]|nr:MAG: TPR-domain containing protein [Candidatus Lokiarchaeota archaeon CR_4]
MDDLERILRVLASGKKSSLTEIAKRGNRSELEIKEEIEALVEYDPEIGSFDAEKGEFTRGKSSQPISAQMEKEINAAITDLKKARVDWQTSKSEDNPIGTAKIAERILLRTKEILRNIGRVGYMVGDVGIMAGGFDLSKMPETDQRMLKEIVQLLASKIENPISAAMWVHAAWCAFKLGLVPEAAILCETARNITPKFGPAWKFLGYIRKSQKNFSSAERAYEKAVEIYPKTTGMWIALGSTRLKQENYVGAEQAADEALKIHPQETETLLFLCEIRLAQKDFASVEQVCEDALKVDSKNTALWRMLGTARLALLDYDGVLQACEQALAIDPKFADVLNLQGTARYLKADVPGAIQAYEKSLELDSKNGFAWVNLGEAYESTGREGEALYCYEQGAAWGESRGSQKAADLYAREINPVPPKFQKNTSQEKAKPAK